jgi:trehalose synthase
MLHTLLGYVAGAGVRTRWLVLEGDPEFFALTKRLHNAIHGIGDGTVGATEHEHYDRVLARNVSTLLDGTAGQDLVMLHDPQTAGLVRPVRNAGLPVVWRCHIGLDAPTATSRAAWNFLRPYVESADAFVYSRRQYAPSWVPADRLWVIPPSIDPLSPKNRPLSPDECLRILTQGGLLAGAGESLDASGAPVVQGAPAPTAQARLVVQVSRWDRLKDMPGVMAGFARTAAPRDTHLMLVGPAVTGVSDDPEGATVLADCLAAWRRLPQDVQERVHLASVPTDDPIENATIVNAVQRHAAVVVQKSLAEGFGLTVTEAMWKGRPVLASAVGGIRDQIRDGRDGLLVSDPHDLDAFAAALHRLLHDQPWADRLGDAAHQRVRDQYLGDRHLGQYGQLFETLLATWRPGSAAIRTENEP